MLSYSPPPAPLSARPSSRLTLMVDLEQGGEHERGTEGSSKDLEWGDEYELAPHLVTTPSPLAPPRPCRAVKAGPEGAGGRARGGGAAPGGGGAHARGSNAGAPVRSSRGVQDGRGECGRA